MSAEISFASNIFTNNSNCYNKSFLDCNLPCSKKHSRPNMKGFSVSKQVL